MAKFVPLTVFTGDDGKPLTTAEPIRAAAWRIDVQRVADTYCFDTSVDRPPETSVEHLLEVRKNEATRLFEQLCEVRRISGIPARQRVDVDRNFLNNSVIPTLKL